MSTFRIIRIPVIIYTVVERLWVWNCRSEIRKENLGRILVWKHGIPIIWIILFNHLTRVKHVDKS